MYLSSVDRLKVEIRTPELQSTWSSITGSLDSLVYLPMNFEWIGRGNIHVKLVGDGGEQFFDEISDIEFSEDIDEKSCGFQLIIISDNKRLRLSYKVLYGFPAIYIKAQLLISNSTIDKCDYFPFYIYPNKQMKKIDSKIHTENNKSELASIESESGAGILFFGENGIEIGKQQLNENIIYVKCKQKITIKGKNNIDLPLFYFAPYSIGKIHNFYLYHTQLIQQLSNYEKWKNEKERM
ncbi:MAG TPA: hypothetical protein PLJ10_01115 [Candidatus Hydrogenedens sp.]|nr:hypothetical protein [Candidatus Hydrogenedens sp.]